MKTYNKNQKYFVSLLSSACIGLGFLFLTACGSGNSSVNPNINGPQLYPAGYNPLSVPYTTKIGMYAENKPAYQNSYSGYYGSSPYASGSAVSSYQINGSYKDMLKQAMGVCDRDAHNSGLSSCNSWMSGDYFHDVTFQLDGQASNTVELTLRSFPTCTGYTCSWYNVSLPSLSQFVLGFFGFPTVYGNPQGVFDPMRLKATIYPINDSKGFEIRAYGPTGSQAYALLFQLQVENGKIEDPAADFNLFYNASLISQGRLVKCQTQTCGL